jgi:uncharacterized protein (TIGR02246 family)
MDALHTRSHAMPGAADVEAVKSFPLRMIEAWNRGSAASFAAPFTGTADFIAFEGTHLVGQRQVVAFHQPLFDSVLRGSRLEGAVKFVRFVTPEVAVMHALGSTALPGQSQTSPSRDSMQLFVAMKRTGSWCVEAMLNARRLTLEQQSFADDFAALPADAQAEVVRLVASLKARTGKGADSG